MTVTLPIRPLLKPSTLNGVENGSVPPLLLDKIGVGNAVMERTAARACRAMIAALNQAGFEVREVGDYRSYEEQVSLFVSRYESCSQTVFNLTPDNRRKVWPDEPRKPALLRGKLFWRKRLIDGRYPATAATPGTSNHGWGLALDFAQETDGDPQPESVTIEMVRWLVENAHRFGFSAELQSEPWHWRYVTGDDIPDAVLEYENPGTPVEDDMPVDVNARVVDTRPNSGHHEQGRPFVNGETRKVPVMFGGSVATIRVTALPRVPNGGGFVKVWHPGKNEPDTACVNFEATDKVEGDTVTVGIDGGWVNVKVVGADADLVIDTQVAWA